MTDVPAEQILAEIEQLRTFHRSCRVYFPRLTEANIGCTHIPPVPYYGMHGLEISFVLNRGLTGDDIERNNAIAHWINENVIVRLCALMEYRKLIPKEGEGKIDQSVQGWKELDLVRHLRNIFAHKSGRYNPNNPREKTLLSELTTHLQLDIDDPTDFSLDIAKVIDPLFEGCKSYVRGKLGETQE